ncbi:MAG: HD domain-containing phosphohydrolase [Gaiellaceae bacterium]
MCAARGRCRPRTRVPPKRDTTALRRAALVPDFGTSAVPNSIWDKPGRLTRRGFERVELHPMLTEQMLRRSPAFATLTPAASAHHEKCNGSGYHRRLRSDTGHRRACVLAATEIYVGMTTERADRPRFSEDEAAAELRRLESDRVLEPSATRAVLVAAGHSEPEARMRKRPENRGGLSRREVDVLQLAARGLTTRQIPDRLVISPKTADHHIQHIYTKIGVSTQPPPRSGRCRTTTSSAEAPCEREPAAHLGALRSGRGGRSGGSRSRTPHSGLEHLWSRAGATSGNQWQTRRHQERLKQAETVATGCRGKEGVISSSLIEGSFVDAGSSVWPGGPALLSAYTSRTSCSARAPSIATVASACVNSVRIVEPSNRWICRKNRLYAL